MEKPVSTKQTVRTLWVLSKGTRWWVALETLLRCLMVACTLSLAYILKDLVNDAGVCHAAFLQTGLSFSELWADQASFWSLVRPLLDSVFVLAAVILGRLLLRFAAKRLRSVQCAKFSLRLKKQLMHRLFEKELSARNRYHTGELMNRLTSDVDTVVSQATNLVPNTVATFAQIIGAAVILYTMAQELVLVSLLFGLVVGLFMLLFRKKLKRLQRTVRETDGRMRSLMQESLLGTPIVKAFSAVDTFDRLLEDRSQDHLRSVIRHTRFTAIASMLLTLAFSAAYIVALGWGGFAIVFVEGFTYGSLTAVLQLVGQIRGPLAHVTEIVPHFYSILVAVERLQELIRLPEDRQNTTPLSDSEVRRIQSIEVRDVTFAYSKDGDPVLSHFTDTLHAGEILLLGGRSGIGKTTLMKLLLAFYPPNEGSVTLVTEHGRYPVGADTRPAFSYVPQGNQLFSGTIRENVTLFSACSEERLRHVLHLACADFVYDLEHGLDTELKENGVGISEGQAQRIAIARALFYDAPILLLDEATSALDEPTERKLLENIRSIGKTCLLISHRPGVSDIATRTVSL